jgi:8-amino-3,8-dideoxy-alpha-D-manno-octulosonate transaminase
MPGFEIINHLELKAINSIFKKGGVLFAHGFEKNRKNFHVREFEKKVSTYFKCKHALAVSSGTAAIKIALKALNVKPGDEVITQAFNFIATIEAIIDVGAKPVLVNVDRTLNINIEDLEKKISKKTKVILPVHMLGYACDMKNIKKICKKNKIKLLEDNCESIGGRYNKKLLGTIGDIGILSLDFGKTITTGEGGLILTNNSKYFNYCKQYHDHGHKNIKNLSRGNDKVSIPGFNYRMTEMQGAIGKVQLKKLNTLLLDNKKKFQIIEKNLTNFKHREMPINGQSNYDNFIFFIKYKYEKNKILKILKNYKIGTKNLPDAIKWHCSFYWKHIFNKKEIKNFLKTKKILNKAIAIPILFKKSKSFYEKLSFEINKI